MIMKFKIELNKINKNTIVASLVSIYGKKEKYVFKKVPLTQMELTTLANRLAAKVVWTKDTASVPELKALFDCRVVVYDKNGKLLLSENVDKLRKHILNEQKKLGKRV